MRDKHKTKGQLIKELEELRQRIVEPERSEIERPRQAPQGLGEELQEIIDGVKDGIVILDLTGTVTTINKRVTEVSGYSEKDIIGKRLTRLRMFPPKSIATMFAAFTRVISGQQPPPDEVEVHTKKGEKLCVEIHGSLLKKRGGKAGVLAMLRDVTERKQLEALLLRERDTFVTILQHALYGMVLLDRDAKHVYVNPAFTAITGYTLEDIPTGRDWTHKAYPDEAYRQQVKELWKNDKRLGVTRREIKVVCKNGETKDIEFRPTILDDGRAVVMLADITERKRAEKALQGYREDLEKLVTERTAALQAANEQLQREITERKQVDEELKESEERFRAIFEAAQDLIFIKDRDLKFTAVNPAMERYFGVSASEMVGETTASLFEGQVSERSMEEEDLRVLGGEVIDTEHFFQVQGDTVIQNVVKVPMRNSAGKIIGVCGTARDITERKRMEKELQENEARFRQFFEHEPAYCYMISPEGVIFNVNNAALDALGYIKEELVGKPLQTIYAPESLPKMEQLYSKWKKTEQLKDEEMIIITKKGEKRTVLLSAGAIKDSDGKILHSISVQNDITDQKHIENALRQSEERFRRVVETMEVGLGAIDENGVLTYVNEYLAKMLGYSIEEMIGRSTLDFYYDEESRKVQEEIFKKRRAGMRDPTSYEVTWRRKDGQKVYSILSPTPIFDTEGRYTGSFAIHTDITERKQIEEALRESEEKYRELINGMNDTAWVIDFEGNFIDVNNAAVEVLGYSREELLAMGPHDIDNTLDAEEIRALIKEMPTDKIQVFETTHTAKNGKTIPVEIKSSLVTYQGKRAILSIARDITERKHAEEALLESEKRFRLLVEHSKDASFLHDFDGKIIDINQHACESLGYTREELLSLSVQDIDQNFMAGKHKEKWSQMVLGEPVTLEGIQRRKDGTTFPVEVRLGVLESGGQRLILGLVRDITERARAEKAIRKLAYHDALTGLPNRALFADRLDRAMAQAHRKQKKLAVMLLDLDYFKDINDTLGHSVGDLLLSSVGKRLTGLLRQEDTVSRMGGDEFFLLLPEVDRAQDAAMIAQKVLKAFQEPFVLDVHEVHITTSIGIVMYPDEGAEANALLKNADIALYRAKQKGRNNYQHYTPAMDPGSQGDG